VGRFCVIAEHDGAVAIGDALKVRITPAGCHSSSCISVRDASCEIATLPSGDFDVRGEFCLSSSQGRNGCTADCSTELAEECVSDGVLTAGTHTVTLGELSLTLTVPGALPDGMACAGAAY
jgi:hypothetical protein